MSTVMEPPATIEFEFESPVRVVTPSREAVIFDKMVEEAKEGRWIVGSLFDGNGGHCALGMIARFGYGTRDDDTMCSLWDHEEDDPVFVLLNAVIPDGVVPEFGGGSWDRIATYNNSLTVDEAVAWFERAKLLA